MKSLTEIATEINTWSLANFGFNQSKFEVGVELGSVAAVLGIVEECGEFVAADNWNDRRDGFADFLIYSADYYGRSTSPAHFAELMQRAADSCLLHQPSEPMVCLVSRFAHCNLKSHQGIRTFADPEAARLQIDDAWVALLCKMYWSAWPQAATVDMIMNRMHSALSDVWEKIVSKRNWVANPATAGDTKETQVSSVPQGQASATESTANRETTDVATSDPSA